MNAIVEDAWEANSKSGNEMLVLLWDVDHVGEVRQYLLKKIPGSAQLLHQLLRSGGRKFTGPDSLVGIQAHVEVDTNGEWPSVVEVKVP